MQVLFVSNFLFDIGTTTNGANASLPNSEVNPFVDLTHLEGLFETLLKLIKFNLVLQMPPPLTVRLIPSGESYHYPLTATKQMTLSDNFITTLLLSLLNLEAPVAVLIGNNKPYINSPDKRSISTGGLTGKCELFRYTGIFFIEGDAFKSLRRIEHVIKKTINTRKDRTIFIVQSKNDRERLSDSKVFQELQEKYLISSADIGAEIWTDPMIFNKGKLTSVRMTSLGEPLSRRKMGGLLRGRHLKTGQSEIFHWAYTKGKDKNGNVKFTGSMYSIQAEAMKRFNYTLSVKYLDTYASLVNGTWYGTTGCVLSGECDLSICLSPEYIWGYGMDFSPWITTAELIFWTNFPKKNPKWYGFLRPFSPAVWLCVAISQCIFSFSLLLIMFVESDFHLNRDILDTAIFAPFAYALEQAVLSVPEGVRCLTALWMMGTTVLGTGYKSTLLNNLIFPPEDLVPLTHSELADRIDYMPTLYSFGELELDHFKSSTDPKIQSIYKRLHLELDRVKCLENVLLHYKHTCSSWYPPSAMLIAKYMTINTLVNPLTYSQDHIALSYMTLAFPKDSIFIDAFSPIVSAITEGGIYQKFAVDETYELKLSGVDRWKNASEHEKQNSPIYQILLEQLETKKDEDVAKPLTAISVCIVLLFIPAGCIIGCALFIIERNFTPTMTKTVIVINVTPTKLKIVKKTS